MNKKLVQFNKKLQFKFGQKNRMDIKTVEMDKKIFQNGHYKNS